MHTDNLIFLIVVAVLAVLRLAIKAAGTATKNRERDEPPPRGASQTELETDEQRIRKFLEALGQPPGTTPPPKVTQRRLLPQPGQWKKEFTEAKERARRAVVQGPLPPLTSAPPPEAEEEPRRRVVVPQTTIRREPPPAPSRPFARDVPAPRIYEVPEVLPRTAEAPPILTVATAETLQPTKTVRIGRRTDFRSLLQSPEDLRTLVILREVVGPPRAFDPIL